MPKDFLFPPLTGASRLITLTGNAAFSPNMLGAVVSLNGYTLTLSGASGFGFFVVTGGGNLAGALVENLSSTQAMFVTVEGGTFHFVDQPNVDLGALEAQIALKAPLASPALTGTPTAPTAAPGTNTTQLASTAYVVAALAGKANTGHTHTIGNVTGLQAALDALTATDALKAPLANPIFVGAPLAPTAAPGTNNTQIATTAFVMTAISGLGSGGGGSWGSITGNLSSQTDLWNAIIDAKARANHTGSQAMATITGLDAALTDAKARANHTGTQAMSTIVGLETAITDAKARANHTGSQAISTVTGLQAALDGKAASSHTHSTAQVTGLDAALAAKAPLASPAFTGTPTVPTAADGTNTNQAASTAFVQTALAGIGGGAGLPLLNRTAEQGTPNSTGARASAVIDTNTGVLGNTILFEAVEIGAAGNDINIQILASENSNRAGGLVKTGESLSITPSSRGRIVVTGAGTPQADGTYRAIAVSWNSTLGSSAYAWWVNPLTNWSIKYNTQTGYFEIRDNLNVVQYKHSGLMTFNSLDLTLLPWEAVNGALPVPTLSKAVTDAGMLIDGVNSYYGLAWLNASAVGDTYGAVASMAPVYLTGGVDGVEGLTPQGLGQLCIVGPYPMLSGRTDAYDWFIAESVSPMGWRQIFHHKPYLLAENQGLPDDGDSFSWIRFVSNMGLGYDSGPMVRTSNPNIWSSDGTLVQKEVWAKIERIYSAGEPPEIPESWEWKCNLYGGIGGSGAGNAEFTNVVYAEDPANAEWAAGVTVTSQTSFVTPLFPGHRCYVIGDQKRLEYTSFDGATWTISGPPDVRRDPATPGNVIVTTWTGAVPSHNSVTIASYLNT
jgi:hypothetical protein